MPWISPRDPKGFATELDSFSVILRRRAREIGQKTRYDLNAGAALPNLKPIDFAAAVTPYVRRMHRRAKKLRWTATPACSGIRREDMLSARLKAAEAFAAAAAFLEARVFEDFAGTTDRQGIAAAIRAAADILDEAGSVLLRQVCGCPKRTKAGCSRARGRPCPCACHRKRQVAKGGA
jgi:hypothetical protein